MIRRWFSLPSVIAKMVDVLALFVVEKLLSKIGYVVGAIKIILFKWITTENRECLSVDRFRVCKRKSVSDDEKKLERQIHNNFQMSHTIAIFADFIILVRKNYGGTCPLQPRPLAATALIVKLVTLYYSIIVMRS